MVSCDRPGPSVAFLRNAGLFDQNRLENNATTTCILTRIVDAICTKIAVGRCQYTGIAITVSVHFKTKNDRREQ